MYIKHLKNKNYYNVWNINFQRAYKENTEKVGTNAWNKRPNFDVKKNCATRLFLLGFLCKETRSQKTVPRTRLACVKLRCSFKKNFLWIIKQILHLFFNVLACNFISPRFVCFTARLEKVKKLKVSLAVLKNPKLIIPVFFIYFVLLTKKKLQLIIFFECTSAVFVVFSANQNVG